MNTASRMLCQDHPDQMTYLSGWPDPRWPVRRYVRIRSSPAMRNLLPLGRALRPLRRLRVPGAAVVVDEEATADFRAEHRLWLPILKPVSEPALDLALVIDASESMELWGGLVHGIRRCEQLGAFREIQVWDHCCQRRWTPHAGEAGGVSIRKSP